MRVSLETLRRAVGLVDSLADLDDPAGFAGIALAGLSRLVGCDVLTFNEIGPARPCPLLRFPPRRARPGDTAGGLRGYVMQHPVVNHYRATGDVRPCGSATS